eukprot:797096-Alexandrium_andersonii.AAC.1
MHGSVDSAPTPRPRRPTPMPRGRQGVPRLPLERAQRYGDQDSTPASSGKGCQAELDYSSPAE